MRHLFVIGQPQPVIQNADTEVVATKVTSSNVIVRRCSNPSDLKDIVEEVASDGLIDVLDLFDHATAGLQSLGGAVLFRSDADPKSALVGAELARAIAHCLSDHAHVRLLGCKSALGPEGRLLLFKLRLELGRSRVVFGTIDGSDANDFGQEGFLRDSEVSYLFDSFGAIDGEAPARADRITSYLALLP